ncbi:MAG: HAD hydrolase-like protein [Myxococcota bacterium]|nr:HAD hydrolase-like protein [Myxococcota bacterium]
MIAVIFDVDGTLVNSQGFDDRCYISAVKEVLGDVSIRTDWSEYKTATDVGILLQIMADNDICDRQNVERVRERFGYAIYQHLESTEGSISVPGAVAFFEALQEQTAVKVGIATGDWGHTARMKLVHGGFQLLDEPLVSSDDCVKRIEIMLQCLSRLGGNFDSIIYFGDAQWDLECTRTVGWQFVGVGQELRGKCDLWILDYSDNRTLMDMVLRSAK